MEEKVIITIIITKHKIMRTILVLFCLFGTLSSGAQTILFLGGTAHIGDGSKIATSAIAIKNGKFEMVADARVIRIDPSLYDTIIHVYDQHVFQALSLQHHIRLN